MHRQPQRPDLLRRLGRPPSSGYDDSVYGDMALAPGRAPEGRLFLAVLLPDHPRQLLRQTIDHWLRERTLPGRPTKDSDWHLTLRFFGQTEVARGVALMGALHSLVGSDSFDMRLSGWGAFPTPARARVLWAGVDAEGSGALRALAAKAEAAACEAGFAPESRAFRPHVTLSRLALPADLRGLLAAAPPLTIPWPVRRVHLVRSHLQPSGAVHEPILAWPLAEAP